MSNKKNSEVARLYIHSDIIYNPEGEKFIEEQLSRGIKLIPLGWLLKSKKPSQKANSDFRRNITKHTYSTVAFYISKIASLG